MDVLIWTLIILAGGLAVMIALTILDYTLGALFTWIARRLEFRRLRKNMEGQ